MVEQVDEDYKVVHLEVVEVEQVDIKLLLVVVLIQH